MSDRSRWPIRRRALGEDERVTITGATPSELFAMVEQLTSDAWAMSGRAIADIPRSQLPGRVVRRAR